MPRINHKMWGSRFYNIYYSIRGRCSNKHPNYGGRGIRCEWLEFLVFKDDMYESYLKHCNKFGEKNTTIDRIDVNRNYCKDNCRWATMKEQAKNKRFSRSNFTRWGFSKSVASMAKEYKISYDALYGRLHNGWDIQKALTTPLKK